MLIAFMIGLSMTSKMFIGNTMRPIRDQSSVVQLSVVITYLRTVFSECLWYSRLWL